MVQDQKVILIIFDIIIKTPHNTIDIAKTMRVRVGWLDIYVDNNNHDTIKYNNISDIASANILIKILIMITMSIHTMRICIMLYQSPYQYFN